MSYIFYSQSNNFFIIMTIIIFPGLGISVKRFNYDYDEKTKTKTNYKCICS